MEIEKPLENSAWLVAERKSERLKRACDFRSSALVLLESMDLLFPSSSVLRMERPPVFDHFVDSSYTSG